MLQRKEGCEKPRKRKETVHQGGSFSFQTNGGITTINANTYLGPVTYINSCNSSQNQTRWEGISIYGISVVLSNAQMKLPLVFDSCFMQKTDARLPYFFGNLAGLQDLPC
jgi:hypothetical protein